MLLEKPTDRDLLSLSVSKCKTFKDCKAKYRFNYIEKLPKKDWDFLTFGKFLHEVLETFHKKILDGAQDAFHILMTKASKEALANWGEKLTSDQKKESQAILTSYLLKISKAKIDGTLPTVLSVEKNFYIDIDGRVLLNGFIDRIQLDPDGILHVSDYKTTKNPKYLKKDYFQLLTYAFVMCLEDPTIQKVRTSYLLLRHNCDLIIKEYTRDEIMKVEEQFIEYADSITEEKLFRPNPTMLCGYCDYLTSCEAGQKQQNKTQDRQNLNKFGVLDW